MSASEEEKKERGRVEECCRYAENTSNAVTDQAIPCCVRSVRGSSVSLSCATGYATCESDRCYDYYDESAPSVGHTRTQQLRRRQTLLRLLLQLRQLQPSLPHHPTLRRRHPLLPRRCRLLPLRR